MPTSQNGYRANDPGVLTTVSVPGSGVRFRVRRGPVASVMAYLAARIDNEVEDIDAAGSYRGDTVPSLAGAGPSAVFDDWSYASRPIRGSSTTLSNHASGTAIDINATQHPLGVSGTWSQPQVAAVRRILSALRDPVTGRCVIRWGNDYRSRPDGMHFEINEPEAAVARVAARLGSAPTTTAGGPEMDAQDWARMDARLAEVVRRLDKRFAVIPERSARALLETELERPDGSSASLAGTLIWTRISAARAEAASEQAVILLANQGAINSKAVGDAVRKAITDAILKVDVSVNGKESA